MAKTFQEMFEEIAAKYPKSTVEEVDPLPPPLRCRCHEIVEQINAAGICDECQDTLNRGYEISQLTGRCANGAERDHGILWHARFLDDDGYPNRKAVCGQEPGKRSVGWSCHIPAGRQVTCKRCVRRLANPH